MAEVVIVMGSTSDSKTMDNCIPFLEYFGIDYEIRVMSAHRNPDMVMKFASNAEKNGVKVIIAAAGLAAHLAGVIASHTVLPVLGVPMKGGVMDGMDALLATVQMPAGVPVPTLAIGNAGAKNSAIVAAQIIALNNTKIREKLYEFKKQGCKL